MPLSPRIVMTRAVRRVATARTSPILRSSSLRPTKRPNASRGPRTASTMTPEISDEALSASVIGSKSKSAFTCRMAGVEIAAWPSRTRARSRAVSRRVESRASCVGSPAPVTWMRPMCRPMPGGFTGSRLRSATSAQRVAISVSRPSGSPRPKRAAMCPASRRRTRPPQRSMRLAALSTTAPWVSRGSSMTRPVTSRRSPGSAARSRGARGAIVGRAVGGGRREGNCEGNSTGVRSAGAFGSASRRGAACGVRALSGVSRNAARYSARSCAP